MSFKQDRFKGLIPRAPASLLPEANATVARNCDFAYGELRNTRGNVLINAMANVPAAIHTDDGLKFFSWPVDVDAARSPLASDPNDLLYFTTPTDFRVTARSGMQPGGGVPASSYRVGVPRPSSAPTMTLTEIKPLENAAVSVTFHYEFGGIKYQEQAMLLAPVKPCSSTLWWSKVCLWVSA